MNEIKKATCEKHGDYDSTVANILGFTFESACPICQQAFESENKIGAFEFDKTETAYDLGVGKRFVSCKFEDYEADTEEMKKALAVSKRIVSNFPSMLEKGTPVLFYGNSGTGKSMLASIIARELAMKNVKVIYTTVMQMLRDIRATFNGHGDEKSAIQRFCKTEMLIVEEIGVQLNTPYEIAVLHEIIDERYKNMLPILITSNLGNGVLDEYLGKRIMRRFNSSGGVCVPFEWEEYRGNR